MNKSFLLTILIILFIPITLFSQIKITGKIVNQKDEVLELIEVLILNKDSITIKSELTNIKGGFSLSAEKGEYHLQVRKFGTILWKQKINLIDALNLGIITITEKEQHLAEVVVMSKKKLIERKVDRLVFNVENSIAATGGDALDALKVTPGIRVQNDAITMIGKSTMTVMVDDRMMQLSGNDLINFLKTLSSDNIKSIEVITTPPAKYDAAGNSGIVNIKLKKIKPDSWNSAIRTTYTLTTYPAGSLGGNFNYDKNKISINSDGGYTNGSTAPFYNTTFFYPNQLWIEENTNRNFYDLVRGRLGINYKFTDKFNIGLQYLGSYNKKKNIEGDYSILSNITSNIVDSLIVNKAKNNIKNKINSYDVYSKIKLDTVGKEILLNFNYLNFTDKQDRNFESTNLFSNKAIIPNSYFSANNVSELTTTNFSGKVDVDMPLKFMNLSFGGKISSTKNKNKLNFFNRTSGDPVLDSLQSNEFIYKENTEALYLSGNKKINDKWETQIGLRLESTQTKGNSTTINNSNNNEYLKLFPTAYISYIPNSYHSFSLNYGRRIQRPYFEFLNPFRIYNNKYQYSEGNPLLKPTFSHVLEFSYIFKTNWTSTLYYNEIIDALGGLIYINPDTSVQSNIILNYYDSKKYGISETYTLNIKKWFESNNNLNLFYTDSRTEIAYIKPIKNALNTRFSTNNNFILNEDRTISISANFSYTFPGTDGFYKTSSYSQLDLALRLLLIKKLLTVSLIGNDVFRSSINTQTSEINNITIKYRNYQDLQFFRCSIVYKFGNTNIKNNQKEFGNEEENSRLKK